MGEKNNKMLKFFKFCHVLGQPYADYFPTLIDCPSWIVI